MLLWPAAGSPHLCKLAPACLVAHQAVECQDLLIGPAPLKEAAYLAVPCRPAPAGAVEIDHDLLPFVAAGAVVVAVGDAVS